MIRKAVAGIAGIAISALALTACTGATGGSGSDAAASVSLGTTVEPPSWALPQAGQYLPYYQAVYDSLLRQTPDGEFVPMLAESWEYNDDSTVLTLELRDDVTFTDGEQFTAQTAADSLTAFRDSSAPDAANLAGVESVDVIDETTIALNLDAPDPALFFYLAHSGGTIVSPATLESGGADGPIGTGPYIYDADASVAGSSHVFTANPDYWAPELQQFDKIEFRLYADPTATVNALRSGQIAGANIANPSDIDALVSAGFVDNVIELDWQGLMILDREGTLVPELADVRVRQAINYAIDGDAILNTIYGGRGTPTTQIFSPSGDGYVEELDDLYPFDPDQARELLAEAGHPDGFDLSMPRATGVDPAVYTAIEQNLADVGIRVSYTDVTVNDLINGLLSGQYAISWFQLGQPSPWRLIQEDIATGSLWNPLGSDIPEVDTLIEGVRAGDAAAAAELNTYVVENAWFNPWFRVQSSYVTNSDIEVDVQNESPVPAIYNYRPAQ